MIREAKGVAIHDLSFWASCLPFMDGLHRISEEFTEKIVGGGVFLRLDSRTGTELHDGCLEELLHIARGEPAAAPVPRRLAEKVTLHLSEGALASPRINVELEGCGIVLGGRCDAIWDPYLVELKLTAKPPGVRDVRQILVYSGLLLISGVAPPEIGAVINPRLGVCFRFNIDELLLLTGGLTMPAFADRLAEFLSSLDLDPA